jgi:hypothetical protein
MDCGMGCVVLVAVNVNGNSIRNKAGLDSLLWHEAPNARA